MGKFIHWQLFVMNVYLICEVDIHGILIIIGIFSYLLRIFLRNKEKHLFSLNFRLSLAN